MPAGHSDEVNPIRDHGQWSPPMSSKPQQQPAQRSLAQEADISQQFEHDQCNIVSLSYTPSPSESDGGPGECGGKEQAKGEDQFALVNLDTLTKPLTNSKEDGCDMLVVPCRFDKKFPCFAEQNALPPMCPSLFEQKC